MRKAAFIGIAILAALALSVGALAYPAVVGSHALATTHPNTPANATHPRGDDNSTGNQTHENENETGDHEAPPGGNETENETGGNETAPPFPEANETENETFNGSFREISVEHNVTVVQVDNTTWINGTIVVVKGNQTLVNVTFQIIVYDNGTANVTFNGTHVIGNLTVTVQGMAVFDSDRQAVFVFGAAKATENGTVQWERMFGFEVSLSGSCWP